MKARFLGMFAILLVCVLAGGFSVVAQQGSHGKPQFLTIPIHDRLLQVELKNGHVIYVPPRVAERIENAGEAGPGGVPGPPGGGGGGGGGSDFGQPGGVSVPATCFTNSANNFDATCAKDSYQGEPMLTASATLLVGAENDIYPGNCRSSAQPGSFGDCGLSATVSTNGINWQRFKLSRTWGGKKYLLGFDPSATVDSQGRYFVAYGVYNNGPNGIVVVSSTDSGASWKKTTPVVLSSGSTFEDKFWIAADANAGSPNHDRLYVAWDRNINFDQQLLVSFSSNQGLSWSAPVKINDGNSGVERVIYAFPAVAPDGTVYVLWHDYAADKIYIDKSTDGGSTWGADVAVADGNVGFGVDIGCNGGRSMGPAPQMAIDSGGNIYVVFSKDINPPPGPGRDFDVFITKSTDGGATWSAPQRVSNTSAGDQYLPSIGIDSMGRVNVSYLDRRDDPDNCRTHTYLTRFTDGTLNSSTSTDFRITDEDSLFDGNPNGPGDYQGIACQGSTSHPYFSDHRSSNTSAETGVAGAFEVYSAIKP